MNRIFVTSDWHIGHKNILKYESVHRPFANIDEHDHALIDNYNSVVRRGDTCWFIGDICMDRTKLPLFGRLNGDKKLILGNHDTFQMSDYAHYFTKIRSYHTVHDVILSHIPLHESQLSRYRLNIHGHLHSNNVSVYIPGLGKQDDPRYINVSVEQTNLMPVLLSDLLAV